MRAMTEKIHTAHVKNNSASDLRRPTNTIIGHSNRYDGTSSSPPRNTYKSELAVWFSRTEQPGQNLTTFQQEDLKKLLGVFGDVFSNSPGCTNTLVHDISLQTTDRVQTKASLRKAVDRVWPGIGQAPCCTPSRRTHS
ncbi:hypothetical protein Pmani_006819 [Petrolisthes manimaculis]|uniref:Uncharacterized protein n=1 Tax=Petrolisthes manimaculis TaxID=1843537 RepID=A0AAE1Q8W8_9EUCA|nr:hypothetical protein Pmani_006819 [Petrolisthes manimaculis]